MTEIKVAVTKNRFLFQCTRTPDETKRDETKLTLGMRGWPEISVISRPQSNPGARNHQGIRLGRVSAKDDKHFRLHVQENCIAKLIRYS